MNRPAFLSVLSILLSCPIGNAAEQTTDPVIPVGSLSVTPTVVREGTYPTMKWNITYPSVAEDVVKISPEGTLTATSDCYADVRVLGAAVSDSIRYYPVEAQVKFGTESWNRVFYARQQKVRPDVIVYTRFLPKGQTLAFGGRYSWEGNWSAFFDTTQKGSKQSAALVNGSNVPPYLPAYDQPSIESFLRPYLDKSSKVKIGPMDVIYLFELTTRKVGNQFFSSEDGSLDPDSSGFDMQDLCILVTLRKA